MEEYIIPKIEVRKGSITTLRVHAIVNPANSFGFMGGGVGEAIKLVGGQSIEDEAIEQAPVEIGNAFVTSAGDLPCQKVIHAPTMHDPGERTDSMKVRWAADAALRLADDSGFTSIAIPGMGTGIGGVGKEEAAEAIIDCIRSMKFRKVEKITLIDLDDDMVKAFENQLKKRK